MNVALIISNGHSYIAHFAKVKGQVVLMEVWCYPAYPYTTGLLSRIHAYRVVILCTWIETQGATIREDSTKNIGLKSLK